MPPNNPASPPEDRLSTRTKISFGVGNLSVLIGKLAPKQLALPVYNDALGVNSGAISSILGLIVVVAEDVVILVEKVAAVKVAEVLAAEDEVVLVEVAEVEEAIMLQRSLLHPCVSISFFII